MKNTTHTPGPWGLETVPTSIGSCHKIGPFPNIGAREETYACVYADNVRISDYGSSGIGDELLANARLIASAPEILKILIDCVPYLESSGWTGGAPLAARINVTIAKIEGKM